MPFKPSAVFYNDALDLLHQGAENFSTLIICPHTSDPIVGALEKDTDVIDSAIDTHKLRVDAILSDKGMHTQYKSA